MKDKKFDIFEILKRLNHKDVNYFRTLSEEDEKHIPPFVVQRWFSGTDDQRQIVFLNEFVNPYVFSLSNHRKLLFYLLLVSSSGNRKNRYKYLKHQRSATSSLALKLIASSLKCSSKKAKEYFALVSNEELIQTAMDMGWQSKDITSLKQELKQRASKDTTTTI